MPARRAPAPIADPAAVAVAVEAVLRTLPAPPVSNLSPEERERRLIEAVHTFCGMFEARQRQPATPKHFRPVGRAQTDRDIRVVAQALERLADAYAGLHRPAVGLLADLPPGQNVLQPWLLAARLRHHAERCRNIDTARVPARPERLPHDPYVDAVATNALSTFWELTRTAPAIATIKVNTLPVGTGGRFVDFLRELFAVLGIQSSAASAARVAVRRMHAAPPPPHHDPDAWRRCPLCGVVDIADACWLPPVVVPVRPMPPNFRGAVIRDAADT